MEGGGLIIAPQAATPAPVSPFSFSFLPRPLLPPPPDLAPGSAAAAPRPHFYFYSIYFGGREGPEGLWGSRLALALWRKKGRGGGGEIWGIIPKIPHPSFPRNTAAPWSRLDFSRAASPNEEKDGEILVLFYFPFFWLLGFFSIPFFPPFPAAQQLRLPFLCPSSFF